MLPSSGAGLSAETDSICIHVRSNKAKVSRFNVLSYECDEYMKEMYMLPRGSYIYHGEICHAAEKNAKHQFWWASQSTLSQN
jgi:hypothetical protein